MHYVIKTKRFNWIYLCVSVSLFCHFGRDLHQSEDGFSVRF